jgi:hypothetical protein
MVTFVNSHYWNVEDGNKSEHFHQLFQDFEIGVNSISEQKERVLVDLLFSLWKLEAQLLQHSNSQLSVKFWFWWTHATFQAWQDVLLSNLVLKWMHILDIHKTLVDLLSSKSTVILRLS